MNGILRFVGLLNVAVWLGGTVFLIVVAAPALSSSDTSRLLGPANFPYYSGAIAQLVLARWFHLQIVCGIIALLQLLGQRLCSGRFHRKLTVGLAVALFAIAIAGANWMTPRIQELHSLRYTTTATPAQRDTAARSLRNWHWLLQFSNLLTLSGLVIFGWQLDHPPDNTRFVSSVKFRG